MLNHHMSNQCAKFKSSFSRSGDFMAITMSLLGVVYDFFGKTDIASLYTKFDCSHFNHSWDIDEVSKVYKNLCYGRGTTQRACQYRKKLAIDKWPWHTLKVITVAAIKWPYGISLPVCGLFFQCLSRTIFKTLPLMKWTWLPVTLRNPCFCQ